MLPTSGLRILSGPGAAEQFKERLIESGAPFAPDRTFAFTNDIKALPQFEYGKQNFPTPVEIAKASLGVESATDIREDIKDHNEDVEDRAKTLTYLQSIGAKIPPRLVIAGAGGKAAAAAANTILRTAPRIPPNFVLPEVLVFVPQGIDTSFTDLDRTVQSWSPQRRFLFTHPDSNGVSQYANYLSAGGFPIDSLQGALQSGFDHPSERISLISGEPLPPPPAGDLPLEPELIDPDFKVPPETVPLPATPPPSPRSIDTTSETKTAPIQGLPAGISRTEFNSIFIQSNKVKDLGLSGKLTTVQRNKIKSGAFLEFLRDYADSGGDLRDIDEIRKRWLPEYDRQFDKKGTPREIEPKPAEDIQPAEEKKLQPETPPETQPEQQPEPAPENVGRTRERERAVFEIDPRAGGSGVRVTETPITAGEGPPSDPKPSPSGADEEKKGPESKDEDDEEERKRRKIPPFPIPDKEKKEEDAEEEKKALIKELKEGDKERLKHMKLGRWRPLAPTGGQSVLLLTGKEKIEEVKDWDMFDLPIDNKDELTNPIYRDNVKQLNFRHFGLNGDYRPANFYKEEPRQFTRNEAAVKAMQPLLISQHMETPFRNPYDRTPFETPNPRDRTAQSVANDVVFRSGLIHPDFRLEIPDNSFGIPQNPLHLDPVNLALAMK